MDIITGYATGPNVGAAMAKKIIPDGGLTGARYSVGGCIVRPTSANNCRLSQTPSANGYYAVTCNVNTLTNGQAADPGPPGTDPMAGGSPANPNDTSLEPSATPPSPQGSCPAGSVPSGQDSSGMTICIGKTPSTPSTPASTTTTSQPPAVTSNPDGSTTTTQVSSSTNADGSVTTVTKVTTVGADGSVVTKTDSVTKKPDGSVGGKDDATAKDEKSDLCKLHPELNICNNSQVQGTCALITCTGDAIQCATLRAAATMQCAQQKQIDDLNASPMKALGDSVIAGNDPIQSQIDGLKNGTTVDMQSLDQNGWLGGGSCFADKSFSVQGHSVTIPFSRACSALVVLRYAIMIVAMLVSFKIVSGAVIRE
jgi:hypothetical protein